jgi:hypothetical protein
MGKNKTPWAMSDTINHRVRLGVCLSAQAVRFANTLWLILFVSVTLFQLAVLFVKVDMVLNFI